MVTLHFAVLFAEAAESCNELLKFRSTVTKIVVVLTNVEISGPKLVLR